MNKWDYLEKYIDQEKTIENLKRSQEKLKKSYLEQYGEFNEGDIVIIFPDKPEHTDYGKIFNRYVDFKKFDWKKQFSGIFYEIESLNSKPENRIFKLQNGGDWRQEFLTLKKLKQEV